MSTFDAVSHKYVLADLVNSRGYQRIAEVGVKRGATLLHLLDACPGLHKAIGIDLWENEVEQLPSHYEILSEMARGRHAGRLELVRCDSARAAERYPDRSFDLVFIDADHSEESVRRDIIAWRPKVRAGGLLCGHDIDMDSVRKAVEDLCNYDYQVFDQQVWLVDIQPTILCMVPYADDRNLGRAYNEAMALLPEDGWGVLLDHDAMFTTPDWHRQIARVIHKQPDGCFVPVTNRLKCPYQQVAGVDVKNHDYRYHRLVGDKLLNDLGRIVLVDVTDDREPAGLCMVVSKAAWQDAGGFPQGMHYTDRVFWAAVKKAGRRIYLMPDLYVYHYHRGNGEPIQAGRWARSHTMPDGKVLRIINDKLPEYDGRTR